MKPARADGFRWTPGNCYRDALIYVMDVEPSATLIHGIAWLVAPDGRTVFGGHAWVEVTRGGRSFCIDQLTGGPMPSDDHRRRYGAVATARYTLEQACARMIEANHWGPWDDE